MSKAGSVKQKKDHLLHKVVSPIGCNQFYLSVILLYKFPCGMEHMDKASEPASQGDLAGNDTVREFINCENILVRDLPPRSRANLVRDGHLGLQ